MKKKAYSRLSCRVAYKNKWFKLREDEYIRPDGKVGIYGYVEGIQGVCVLPLTDDNSVFLLQQYRYPLKADSWEVVNGSVGSNESRLSAAKRELEEEAGFRATKWTYLGSSWPSAGYSKEQKYYYLAQGLTKIQKKPENTEQFLKRRFSLETALKMLRKGEIKESATCLVLYKVNEFLQRKAEY
jgi:8-oxo-dGTP pyrophosphatase MutT (NUDIX family)